MEHFTDILNFTTAIFGFFGVVVGWLGIPQPIIIKDIINKIKNLFSKK